MKKIIFILVIFVFIISEINPRNAEASYHFSSFRANPPVHILSSSKERIAGLSPSIIKKAYNLPESGGTGTIAIITAYNTPRLEQDLSVFNQSFNISACSISNGCLENHKITNTSKSPTKASDTGWSLETSLDVEWAHAIAPNAHILIVEAPTPSGENLLRAIDYAKSRKDVVAISMSWGGLEFPEETTLDSHFKNSTTTTNNSQQPVFFAASGDSGAGVNWPAVSPYVIAVGGTRLTFTTDKNLAEESAWTGSGGGISAYENQPAFQKNYNIPRAKGMRSIPDVSYNADPRSGYAVFRSTSSSNGKWYVIGGTSAGSPQWAAIHSLGLSVSLDNLYKDKSKSDTDKFFRDITIGTNGTCRYYCKARSHYDYVTGLGSPQTINF